MHSRGNTLGRSNGDESHEGAFERLYALATGSAVLGILAVDLATSSAIAVGLLYVPVVFAAALSRSPRLLVAIATGAAVATLLGLALAPETPGGVPFSYVLSNRIISVVAIAASAWLGLMVVRSDRRLRRTRDRLVDTREELVRQTDILDLAGQAAHFGGWSVDLREQLVVWSPEVYRIHRLPEGTPVTVADGIGFYATEHQETITSAFTACAERAVPFDLELKIRCADGEERWVNAIGRPRTGPDGIPTHVDGAFQDIHDRKLAELELIDRRRDLETLADAMPLLVWTTGPEGGIDYYSRGLADYTGASPGEILGSSWVDLLHPDDREAAVAAWTRSWQTGAPYAIEFRIRRHDGAYRWHLTSALDERAPDGTIVKWWGSCIDIDEERALARESGKLTAKLSETLESIGDAVLSLDHDWRVLVLNSNAERLLRVGRAELVGTVIWDAFPEARDAVFGESFRRAISEGREERFEALFEPLGMWVDVSAFPHPEGLTVYFRDITEQRALADQLAHARRLDALGQLTGGVAHDFNNLLTVMMGNAELLVEETSERRDLNEMATSIVTATQSGSALTHAPPRLCPAPDAGARPGRRRRPGRSAPPRGAAHLPRRRRRTPDRQRGCRAVPGGPVPARERRAQPVPQRARRDAGRSPSPWPSTPDELDARLSRHTHVDVLPGRLRGDLGERHGHRHRPGRPRACLRALLHHEGPGPGLGSRPGHRLRLHEAVRRTRDDLFRAWAGTTVRLYLPVTTSAAPRAPRPLSAPEGGGELILLVEDDHAVRRVAGRHLESLGYRVMDAVDGPSALGLIHAGAEVDLLVSDVTMPGGMTGPELASGAEKCNPGCRCC